MSRAPPATLGSGKNDSGHEAFGSKVPETPVTESLAASAADVTSAATMAGAAVASEAEKAGTSAPPTAEGESGDRSTSEPQEVPPPRAILDEGMEAVNNEDRCLYAGTPWEADRKGGPGEVQGGGANDWDRDAGEDLWQSSFGSCLSCLNTIKFL
jgi:hypothetical protein